MKSLHDFWKLVADVWQKGLMGVDVGRIILALGLFILFLLLRGVFSRFILGRLGRLVKKTETLWDDRIYGAIESPLRFSFVVLGLFLFFEVLGLKGDPALFADRLMRSLIVFTIFWSLVRIVEPIAPALKKLERVFTSDMLAWLFKIVRGLLVFVGGATILEIWGIKVGPLLAGLGLFGVAIALGAKDLFTNLIAGLSILAEKRFKVGDYITVPGLIDGTVEQIGFRSTLVRTLDKIPVYVPNSKLSDGALYNNSRRSHRRINWKIGLEYRVTIEQLKQVRQQIEDHIVAGEEFAMPPEANFWVRVDSFGASSIDLAVSCFTKTLDYLEYIRIKEEMAYRVKDIVEGAGAGFAFPSQSVYMETWPDAPAEVFLPPGSVENETAK